MSEERAPRPDPAPARPGEPPRLLLYLLYVALVVVLLTVLILVGVYGT